CTPRARVRAGELPPQPSTAKTRATHAMIARHPARFIGSSRKGRSLSGSHDPGVMAHEKTHIAFGAVRSLCELRSRAATAWRAPSLSAQAGDLGLGGGELAGGGGGLDA